MPVSLASAPATTHGALVPIAYATLGSDGSFDFANIPQTYQDLYAVVFSRSTSSFNFGSNCDYLQSYFNNSAATTVSFTYLNGNGTSASSSRFVSQNACYVGLQPNVNATAGIFSSTVVHILNYANTSTYKTIISRSAVDLNGSGNTWESVNLWQSTSAISRLNFYTGSGGNLKSGATAALYGVRTVGQ